MIELHTWAEARAATTRKDAALLLETKQRSDGKRMWYAVVFEKDGTANLTTLLYGPHVGALSILWTERGGWMIDTEEYAKEAQCEST